MLKKLIIGFCLFSLVVILITNNKRLHNKIIAEFKKTFEAALDCSLEFKAAHVSLFCPCITLKEVIVRPSNTKENWQWTATSYSMQFAWSHLLKHKKIDARIAIKDLIISSHVHGFDCDISDHIGKMIVGDPAIPMIITSLQLENCNGYLTDPQSKQTLSLCWDSNTIRTNELVNTNIYKLSGACTINQWQFLFEGNSNSISFLHNDQLTAELTLNTQIQNNSFKKSFTLVGSLNGKSANLQLFNDGKKCATALLLQENSYYTITSVASIALSDLSQLPNNAILSHVDGQLECHCNCFINNNGITLKGDFYAPTISYAKKDYCRNSYGTFEFANNKVTANFHSMILNNFIHGSCAYDINQQSLSFSCEDDTQKCPFRELELTLQKKEDLWKGKWTTKLCPNISPIAGTLSTDFNTMRLTGQWDALLCKQVFLPKLSFNPEGVITFEIALGKNKADGILNYYGQTSFADYAILKQARIPFSIDYAYNQIKIYEAEGFFAGGGNIKVDQGQIFFDPITKKLVIPVVEIAIVDAPIFLSKDLPLGISGNINAHYNNDKADLSGNLCIDHDKIAKDWSTLKKLAAILEHKSNSDYLPVMLDLTVGIKSPFEIKTEYAIFDCWIQMVLKEELKNPRAFLSLWTQNGLLTLPNVSFDLKDAQCSLDSTRPDRVAFQIDMHEKTKGHKIQLSVTGLIEDPHIQIASDPYLTKKELLALLLTGNEKASWFAMMPTIAKQAFNFCFGKKSDPSIEIPKKWLSACTNASIAPFKS